MKTCALLLAVGLLALAPAAVLGQPSAGNASSLPAGLYSGSYQCSQGRTPVRVEIAPDGTGRFQFGAGGLPAGSYRIQIAAIRDGQFELRPTGWEQRPAGYVMVPVRVRLEGAALVGSVLSPGCGAFNAIRAASPPPSTAAAPNRQPSPREATVVAQAGRSDFRAPQPSRGGGGAVDAMAIIPGVEARVAVLPDKRACVIDSARNLPQPGLRYRSPASDPILFESFAKGVLCLRADMAEGRATLRQVLQANASSADFAVLPRALGPLIESYWELESSGNDIFRTYKDVSTYGAEPARSATSSLKLEWPNYYGIGDEPAYLAYKKRLVDHIVGLRSPQELQALATALLPLFNIEFGVRATYIDLADEDGAVKARIARGEDFVGEAKRFPSMENIQRLLIAQSDPTARTMIARQGQTLPGPKPQELAEMFARGFYAGHPGYRDLERVKTLTKGPWSTFGYFVAWSLPPVPGVSYLYRDTYIFVVNDYVPPDCKPLKAGYRCNFQVAVIEAHDNLVADMIAGALGAAGDGRQQEARWAATFRNRAFNWSSITLDVTGSGGVWSSPIVAQKMAKAAADTTRARDAMARNASASAEQQDPTAELMNEWNLNQQLEMVNRRELLF